MLLVKCSVLNCSFGKVICVSRVFSIKNGILGKLDVGS